MKNEVNTCFDNFCKYFHCIKTNRYLITVFDNWKLDVKLIWEEVLKTLGGKSYHLACQTSINALEYENISEIQ